MVKCLAEKNRKRDKYSFANINLFGKCNVDCFFCLGKDLEELFSLHDQVNVPFSEWKNFSYALDRFYEAGIRRVYLTGQNTDPLLYAYLRSLILYVQSRGFECGIRTNGYQALQKMEAINLCKARIGYTVHSFNPSVNKMIVGRKDIPDWAEILKRTVPEARVSIVVNRCNEYDVYETIKRVSALPNVAYIQMRRVSTDTRIDLLQPDISAFERVYTTVKGLFRLVSYRWADAEIFDMFGKEVVFWRTVKTSANSMNYFTDGTFSDEYFIIEGYLKNREGK